MEQWVMCKGGESRLKEKEEGEQGRRDRERERKGKRGFIQTTLGSGKFQHYSLCFTHTNKTEDYPKHIRQGEKTSSSSLASPSSSFDGFSFFCMFVYLFSYNIWCSDCECCFQAGNLATTPSWECAGMQCKQPTHCRGFGESLLHPERLSM